MLHVKEFIEKTRVEKNESAANLASESLTFFNKYPTLTRRLANIYESNHGDLTYNVNPWYEEMQKINIEAKHIEIIADFIVFDDALRIKERDEYMAANGYEL